MNEKRHLWVYGVVINNVQILLVKKTWGVYTGKYDLPGGSIKHGEKPIETLKRDMMEEIGMSIDTANLIGVNSLQ